MRDRAIRLLLVAELVDDGTTIVVDDHGHDHGEPHGPDLVPHHNVDRVQIRGARRHVVDEAVARDVLLSDGFWDVATWTKRCFFFEGVVANTLIRENTKWGDGIQDTGCSETNFPKYNTP